MPNGVKYSTTTPSGSLRRGNVALGVNGNLGPTANTGFYSMPTPASGKYIINKVAASGVPNFFAPQNDTELIQFARNEGATGANTGSAAAVLSWIATQVNLEAANIQYESIVTDSLVLNLDAGFVGSYPTTASTWYDISGNGSTVTNQKGPGTSVAASWNSSGYWVMNNSVALNTNSSNGFGLNGYVPISGTKSFTFEAWVRLNSLTSQTSIINNAGSCPGYRWGLNGDGSMYWLIGPADGCTGYSEGGVGSGISTGVWLQLVGVFDKQNELGAGSKFYSYVNGSVTGDISISPNTDMYNGAPNIINGSCCRSMDGDLAIIRIYNKALTSTEITTNWNAQKSRFGL